MMNGTTNYEDLKVAELKDLCRKAGIKGYSKMRKSELIDALNNSKELKKVIHNEAKDFAHTELGRDFNKAVMFWKRVNNLKRMETDDYYRMIDAWKLLVGLLGLVDDDIKHINITDNLQKTAQAISSIFCVNEVDFSAQTDEEARDYILETLNSFSLSVFSKKLTKDSDTIIKMSMEHIDFTKDALIFDSREARKFIGDDAKNHKGDMRIVETAEDAITRMLQSREKPLSSITVFMGQTSQDEVAMAQILGMKRRVFSEGFTDVATGKHYMFAFQNPSSCRKANFMFVEANSWDEVFALWLEITGLKTWSDFEKAFYDENGNVNMAKLLARVSTRGSNSFSVDKTAPDLADVIRNFRPYYCKDTKTEVFKDYKTLKGPGLMDLVTGQSRKLTDADGQGIVSFHAAAIIAAALCRISRYELAEFQDEFAKAKNDIHNVKPGSRLESIIKKIPAAFQIRHGEKKGMLVRWNLEAIDTTKDYDVIIPDSVRKFIGGEWSDYPLEVCNFLKPKGDWAYLNPQFISALGWEDPNALIPIANYWAEYERESIVNMAKAQQFHGIIKSVDDEDNKTNAGHLNAALRVSPDLLDDFQILKWRKEQYNTFNSNMTIGRMMVRGQYTYMIFDPAYQINKYFNLELPCLASGEFYHNGKECNAALFRSPLIAPYEAKKVTLVNNEEYKYLADTVIFNGFDGAADDMGGGDHDGDTCEIVTDDNFFGKIIVDGVRDIPYVVWEKGQDAQKVKFSVATLIEHLTNTAVQSRVGVITNYATCAMDIANHLVASVHFAKRLGCQSITMLHPRSFGKGLGWNYIPNKQPDGNSGYTFLMKGYVECQLTRQGYNKHYTDIKSQRFHVRNVEPCDVIFSNEGNIIGTYTFEQVEDIAKYFLGLVEILRILQGREIDGAKTGVYAEGVSGKDFIEAVKVVFAPKHLLTRQDTLERSISTAAMLNQYTSLSPLGRLHDYSVKVTEDITDKLANGSNKIFLLQSLLSEEEVTAITKTQYMMPNNKVSTLVAYLTERKQAYNTNMYKLKEHYSGEELTDVRQAIKDIELYGTKLDDGSRANDGLYSLAEAMGIAPELVAVASYIATYTKNSKPSDGLSYAWLMFDELLSVFSRNNKKFELFRLPASVESVCIIDKAMYVNGNKYININAYDQENVPIQVINGRPYAFVHKTVDNTVAQRKGNITIGNRYIIGVYGFKYHTAQTPAGWLNTVNNNGLMFDIVLVDGRVVTRVNNESVGALMPVGADFDLNNAKVRVINDINNPVKETNASLTNIIVEVVGEAD